MVVDVVEREDRSDLIFHALADRTRRDIVRRTVDGDVSMSALARYYPISNTAVQKHVATLERAELVHRTRRGREQLVRSRRDTVVLAGRLLDEFHALWRGRIERIDDLVHTDDAEGGPK